jgi:hypothetical protein
MKPVGKIVRGFIAADTYHYIKSLTTHFVSVRVNTITYEYTWGPIYNSTCASVDNNIRNSIHKIIS